MKCGFASDLHGHPSHYVELLGLVRSDGLDLLILGGDLLPRKGHHHASLELQQVFLSSEFRGFAERILRETGAPLCAIPGNDDWAGAMPLFKDMELEGLVRMLDERPCLPDGRTAIFGYSFVPPTPFLLKDFEKRDLSADPGPCELRRVYVTRHGRVEETDEKPFFETRSSIEEDLNAPPFSRLPEPSVVVMHGPPFGTALDRLFDGRSAGSKAVRGFLMNRRPLLSLHGHIHESPSVSGAWAEWVGNTLAVNPGQAGNRLSAVLFELENPVGTMVHTVYGPVQPHGMQSIPSS